MTLPSTGASTTLASPPEAINVTHAPEKAKSSRRRGNVEDLGPLLPENAKLIGDWCRSLRNRNLSSRTVEAYALDLEQLARSYAHAEFGGATKEPGTTLLSDITGPGLHDWMVDFSDGGPDEPEWTAATVRRKTAAIRQFYKWLIVQRGVEMTDPSHFLATAKPDPQLTKFLEADELEAIFQYLEERSNADSEVYQGLSAEEREGQALIATLDRIVAGLCYYHGLRISGAVGIEMTWMNVEASGDISFRTLEKGNKWRVFVAHPRLTPFLHRYLAKRPLIKVRNPADRNFVFLYPPSQGVLSRQNAFRRIRAAAVAVLGERGASVSPHWLRHTLGTHMNDEGYDIRMIQKALGHANVNTTQRYTHVREDEVEQILRSRDTDDARAARSNFMEKNGGPKGKTTS